VNIKRIDYIVNIVTDEYIKAKTESKEWKQLVRRSLKYERGMKQVLRSYFIAQERKTMNALTKFRKAVSFPFLEKEFINSQKDELSDIIYPLIKRIVNNEGTISMEALQSRVTELIGDFKLDDDVLASIQSMVRTAASEVTETTFKRLLIQYDTGLELGETISEIKQRMTTVFQDAVKNRVDTIARTEVMRASNESRLLAYEQSGVVNKVRWYTAVDERRCNFCASLHNKAVKIGKEFSKDIKAPPAHVGCRCVLLPEVDPQYLKSWVAVYKNRKRT